MKRIIAAVVLFASVLHLSAQSMQFLNIIPDSESAGVAGASVSRKADAYAAENNSAFASLSEKKMKVAAGYGAWRPSQSKTDVISVAGFCRLGDRFALSASFKDFLEPSYNIDSEDGRPGSSFAPKELAASLGLSYSLGKGFSVGIVAKFANSCLAQTAEASTVCADISMAYGGKSFSAGLSVCNVGGKVKYGSSSYCLPTAVRAGASYSIAGITASAEADYVFQGGFMAGAGLEYLIVDIVSVRAGYHYGNDGGIPPYASLGLGVRLVGISLNAAYLLASKTLGGTFCFGLGYEF